MPRPCAVRPDAAGRHGRYQGDAHRRTVAALALLAGAAILMLDPLAFVSTRSAGAASSAAHPTIATRGLMTTPASVPHAAAGRTQLAAEGETTVVAEETEEATEEESPPLFQELIVTNRSTAKSLQGAIVAIFNKGERAVDLVLTDPASKQTLLYTAATVPDQFRASAQLLMRRRDRRLRMRVTQRYRPRAEEDAETLRVAKTSNVTAMGYALASRFVDDAGNNLKRSVKMQFAGNLNAAKALLVIENAQKYRYRKLTFVPRYVEEVAGGDGAEGDGSAAPAKQVSIVVTVTTA